MNKNVEEFIQKYDRMCYCINKRGVFPKLDSVNEALIALINCQNNLEQIDYYMIYNLLLVAKGYQQKIKTMVLRKQYKETVKMLNNCLAKIADLNIKIEKTPKR